jgi:diguanylate cyclase (GGDEF)-like protein
MSVLSSPVIGEVVQGRGSRRRSPIWIAYGLMAIALVAYFVFLIFRGDGQYRPLIDGWLVAGFEVVASVMCIVRGLAWRRGRAVALVLGAGLLSWSIGDMVLTVESLGGATPASPSLADAFYLGFYPLTYVAVGLFMRGDSRRLTTSSWLDGAVAGLGAAALCAAFAFRGIVHSAGGSALAVATNLAYPVGDVLLLGLVVGGTAVLAGRRKAPWMLMAAGIGLNVVGDTFNLFQSSIGASRLGSIVNGIAWPTAILLMSMAVWLRPRPANPLATQRPTGFVLPAVGAAVALVVLLAAALLRVDLVAVGLATATLVVVGIRLALSVRGMRVLTEERRYQSVTDELTGLGNRRHLFHMLDAFFGDQADSQMPDRRLAFLFIDLNHFKEINDSYGHPAGDELLRKIAGKLSGCMRDSDALVRLGGDEFAVVMLDADAESATKVAQRIAASLEEPFVGNTVSARVGASIGIALVPTDATDSAGLLMCADVAMYRAKFGDRSIALYDQDVDGDANRMGLVEELRVAVNEGHFVLHYQPLLDLHSGEVLAVEALLRWPHPRLGLLAPLKFLPLAEDAGLMKALTALVLNQALDQCAAWWAAGRQMSVSVNISATNLLDTGFVDLVRDLLDQHRLPADALVLEITETSIIADFEQSQRVIQQLRDLGLVVSIDDFGAGFTSLAHLSGLAVGELKLDRTFIMSLVAGEQERDLELIRGTIRLGHSLGLRIVAEGIEDADTLSLLSDLGCDLAQGYFIGTPKAAAEFAFQPNIASPPDRALAG